MSNSNNPLFTLTIDQFISLVKEIVQSIIPVSDRDNNSPPQIEHLNIPQCADFLGCSKVSIHNYKKQGMPYYRIGRKVLFQKNEVLEFMRKSRIRTRPPP